MPLASAPLPVAPVLAVPLPIVPALPLPVDIAESHAQGPPSTPSMSPPSVAGPSTPWSARFFIDHDTAPGLSPSISSNYSRCSSEPPSTQDMPVRPQRSRSVSRTPSLPPSDSRTDLKSLPVTPKVASPTTAYIAAPTDVPPLASEPCRPQPVAERRGLPQPHPALRTTPRPVVSASMGSAPVTPDERHPDELHHHIHIHPHAHIRQHSTFGGAFQSTQYTDLFLLEPHEYDSITDGELVRLFDRGVIDGRVLEQIVDASIRIQRACTDADRAVSIKTRRAMIRHALEE